MIYKDQIQEWFNEFHNHPEPSFKEYETIKKIVSILSDLKVDYQTFGDLTGVIAEMGSGDDVIAVRADIDALWQQVDGMYRANHSCGHDAHMAIVLGSILYLDKQALSKRIRFIFQPAEEKGNGSLEMIKHGAMEDVTHLFGIHLRPHEELSLGQVSPSIHHGACVTLEGKISGEDAHGARPHQGRSAIDVIATIYQFLKNIYLSPFDAYSVKLTNIQTGGESLNIIPGHATFGIDIRAQKNEQLKEIQTKVSKGLGDIAALFDVDISFNWKDYTPGAVVSEQAEEMAIRAITEVLGSEGVAPPLITPGSDDFHFYTIKHPNVHATMIGLGADLKPGLHHPQMNFNHTVLDQGARIVAALLKA